VLELDSHFYFGYNTLTMLEKKLIYIELFDEYQLLLTEKQQQIFKLHFHEDFSFTEIAVDLKITKQAVADSLKKSCELLEQLEQKLRLVEKQSLRNIIVGKLLKHQLSDDLRKLLATLQNV